ncbi:hypothetical protein B566_EDAN005274 [Ephemera danica]|nr:hypothetical protein B566_EDAN005274 [Ephemera danica]
MAPSKSYLPMTDVHSCQLETPPSNPQAEKIWCTRRTLLISAVTTSALALSARKVAHAMVLQRVWVAAICCVATVDTTLIVSETSTTVAVASVGVAKSRATRARTHASFTRVDDAHHSYTCRRCAHPAGRIQLLLPLVLQSHVRRSTHHSHMRMMRTIHTRVDDAHILHMRDIQIEQLLLLML